MAEYDILGESPEGDLTIAFEGTQKRLLARREVPGVPQRPIRLDATLLGENRIQVFCLKYRWPDGYEKWGPYIGSIHTLEDVAD